MRGDREEVLGMREDLLSSSTDELLNIHRAGDIKFLKGSLSPDDMGHFGNWRYGFLTWKDMYNSIKNVNTLLSNIDNVRSEEHTSELQSRGHLVCRLLLEKKNKKYNIII